MTQGVIEAIEALKPKLPIFFSVHGTGDEEAIKLLKDRLGVTPLRDHGRRVQGGG